jgi:rhodanese-related sulfurtransferase
VVLLLVTLVAGCGTADGSRPAGSGPAATPTAAERVDVGGRSYLRVAPEALAGTLRSTEVTLVNVHIPYEGEIEATDRFIPYDVIAARTDELPGKGDQIVVYCRTGRMSAIAAATLVQLGYTNVTDLAGGMDAWEAAGNPLVERPAG